VRINTILQSALVLASAFGLMTANAATIGLSSGPLPDLSTSNPSFDYIYVQAQCLDALGSGDSGDCGTSIDVGGTKNDRDFSSTEVVAGSGQLSITGSTMTIEPEAGAGFWFIENGNYTLTANFDAGGLITDASLSILGNVVQGGGDDAGNDFQSGTLALSATMIDFGFQGNGTVGTFEFVFQPVTGDMVDFVGGDTLNVIAASTGFTQLSGFSGVNGWDPLENDDPSIFLQSFSASSGTIDTFVPVPAAAWLFMSALMTLGVVRRKASH
jgi:hypothetical protein